MDNSVIPFFHKYYTSAAIVTYVVLLVICFIFFSHNPLPVLWIIFGLFEVIVFFNFSNVLSKNGERISEKSFKERIFITALVIRVLYVIFIYFFYQYLTGQPFEFEAGDSLFYNNMGLHISNVINSGISNLFNMDWYNIGISDRGFPIFLGLIYNLLFQSVLIARIINALLGAWMCLLIYNLAFRNFGKEAARISAILVMLLPNLIYYTGLTLKETLMVFLLVAFIERSDFLFHTRKFDLKTLIFIIFLGVSIFFFRTALAVAAWFSLFTTLIFIKSRVTSFNRKLLIGLWLIASILVISYSKIMVEIDYLANNKSLVQAAHLEFFATREGGNVFAKYGSTAIFLPLSLLGPLPTLVDTNQNNAELINGAIFTRNVYIFFVIIALILIAKRRLFRNYTLIISFIFSYLAILAASGFAISERFHLPVLPFLIILAGYGITQINIRYNKYYIPYLILISIIILGWNWFKLAGRGVI